MSETPSLFDEQPDVSAPSGSWSEVAEQALVCRNCALWEPAKQTVFGEGPLAVVT